ASESDIAMHALSSEKSIGEVSLVSSPEESADSDAGAGTGAIVGAVAGAANLDTPLLSGWKNESTDGTFLKARKISPIAIVSSEAPAVTKARLLISRFSIFIIKK